MSIVNLKNTNKTWLSGYWQHLINNNRRIGTQCIKSKLFS